MTKQKSIVYDPETDEVVKVLPNNREDQDLFSSLQSAGSSYGITTEFLYRIYPEPEVEAAFTMVYMENASDLLNFERAAKDGRFHLHMISTNQKYFMTSKSVVRGVVVSVWICFSIMLNSR